MLLVVYRDNDALAGKRECDHKMQAELNVLVPEGRREKVDRQLDSWYEVSLD